MLNISDDILLEKPIVYENDSIVDFLEKRYMVKMNEALQDIVNDIYTFLYAYIKMYLDSEFNSYHIILNNSNIEILKYASPSVRRYYLNNKLKVEQEDELDQEEDQPLHSDEIKLDDLSPEDKVLFGCDEECTRVHKLLYKDLKDLDDKNKDFILEKSQYGLYKLKNKHTKEVFVNITLPDAINIMGNYRVMKNNIQFKTPTTHPYFLNSMLNRVQVTALKDKEDEWMKKHLKDFCSEEGSIVENFNGK